MCNELPCVECLVFAICNQNSTERIMECGILMRYILEDSSDKVQVGMRVEITGDQYKRDLIFERTGIVFDVSRFVADMSTGSLITSPALSGTPFKGGPCNLCLKSI